MKLFIQIPCYNERDTLPAVLADLPREIDGVDEIYTLVVDDGSTDGTAEKARELGVDFVLQNPGNLGLAQSFVRGMESCLNLGADIIVHTDGDNQYQGADIPRLAAPVLQGEADMVVGCRDISGHPEFSRTKKLLQKLGSAVVRRLSGTGVPDATSGFRAFSRRAALRLCVMNMFSHTLETLIQAGECGLRVAWVPVGTNPKTRPSRLFSSNFQFIKNQLMVLFSSYLFYRPKRFFGLLSAGSGLVALAGSARIAYYLAFAPPDMIKFKTGTGLLVLFALILCVLFAVSGLFASVFTGHRFLLEDIRFRVRAAQPPSASLVDNRDLYAAPEFFRWKELSAGHIPPARVSHG
ncbi:MAG: glycosyltransferase family 2 protein [Deltaproteobacteria bacterium]|nr:glycosyltransferase family 2 protein [Deltaproteobacteria bacterium]